ncbi:MAG: SpoVG family protein [Firmicutes bacterium]|nr:SpoVG family protein [Bacillota bacterium]
MADRYKAENMALTGRDTGIVARCHLRVGPDFVVTDVTVRVGNSGKPFVAMPQVHYEHEGETKYRDVAFPVTKEGREAITRVVLAEYERVRALEQAPAAAR